MSKSVQQSEDAIREQPLVESGSAPCHLDAAGKELAELKLAHESLLREYNKLLRDNEALNAIINTVVAHDSLLEVQFDDELQKVKYQAGHDALTQIYNRLSFNSYMQQEFRKIHEDHGTLSLIMMDIDHFKKVNDTFGHGKGDEVLIAITSCIKKLLPALSVFSRWGGEEFMILLPGFTISQARSLAEYLRISVEKLFITDVGFVTCSFGVTEYRKDEPLENFFKRIDDSLYDAKENGRNQVRSR